jgi:hypothetical protein
MLSVPFLTHHWVHRGNKSLQNKPVHFKKWRNCSWRDCCLSSATWTTDCLLESSVPQKVLHRPTRSSFSVVFLRSHSKYWDGTQAASCIKCLSSSPSSYQHQDQKFHPKASPPTLILKLRHNAVFHMLALTFWRRTFFFQILAHPVFKMWVIQKPNKVALWNKRHFEGGKMEIIQHVWNIQYGYLLNKYIKLGI